MDPDNGQADRLEGETLDRADSIADPHLRKVRELKDRADIVGKRWLTLYNEPDCFTDPAKRRALLEARIEYQDAVAGFLFALRHNQPASKK